MKINVCFLVLLIFHLLIPIQGENEAHAGYFAARLEWTNEWTAGMDSGLDRQDALIPVQGNHDYTVSVWLRGGNEGITDTMNFTFADFRDDESHIADDPQDWVNTTDDWLEFTYNHTTDSEAAWMNIAFRIVNTNGGAVFIDDVTLVDDTLSSPITISNGGFETWPGDAFSAPPEWRFFEAGGAEGAIQRIEETSPPPPVTVVREYFWRLYE